MELWTFMLWQEQIITEEENFARTSNCDAQSCSLAFFFSSILSSRAVSRSSLVSRQDPTREQRDRREAPGFGTCASGLPSAQALLRLLQQGGLGKRVPATLLPPPLPSAEVSFRNDQACLLTENPVSIAVCSTPISRENVLR